MRTVSWGEDMTAPILCGMIAAEYAEQQLGGLDNLFDMIRDKEQLPHVMDVLFVGMARCAAAAMGEEPDDIMINAMRGWISQESVEGDLIEFMHNRDAILQELNDGFRMDYNGKNKPTDKYSKAVEARMAKKRKKTSKNRMTTRALYSRALESGITYTQARTMAPGFINEMYVRHMETAMETSPLAGMLAMGKRRNKARRA